jgi:hypothetical protein
LISAVSHLVHGFVNAGVVDCGEEGCGRVHACTP